MICPTVRIKTDTQPEGYVEINAEDFDKAKGHVLFNAKDAPKLATSTVAVAVALLGSDNLPALIEVGGEAPMPVGEIVGLAHKESGLTAEKWNDMKPGKREALLLATIERISNANAVAKQKADASKADPKASGWQ